MEPEKGKPPQAQSPSISARRGRGGPLFSSASSGNVTINSNNTSPTSSPGRGRGRGRANATPPNNQAGRGTRSIQDPVPNSVENKRRSRSLGGPKEFLEKLHQQEEEDARRNTISALNANGNEVHQQDAKADAPKTTIPEEIEIKVSKSADDVSTKPNSLATVVRRKKKDENRLSLGIQRMNLIKQEEAVELQEEEGQKLHSVDDSSKTEHRTFSKSPGIPGQKEQMAVPMAQSPNSVRWMQVKNVQSPITRAATESSLMAQQITPTASAEKSVSNIPSSSASAAMYTKKPNTSSNNSLASSVPPPRKTSLSSSASKAAIPAPPPRRPPRPNEQPEPPNAKEKDSIGSGGSTGKTVDFPMKELFKTERKVRAIGGIPLEKNGTPRERRALRSSKSAGSVAEMGIVLDSKAGEVNVKSEDSSADVPASPASPRVVIDSEEKGVVKLRPERPKRGLRTSGSVGPEDMQEQSSTETLPVITAAAEIDVNSEPSSVEILCIKKSDEPATNTVYLQTSSSTTTDSVSDSLKPNYLLKKGPPRPPRPISIDPGRAITGNNHERLKAALTVLSEQTSSGSPLHSSSSSSNIGKPAPCNPLAVSSSCDEKVGVPNSSSLNNSTSAPENPGIKDEDEEGGYEYYNPEDYADWHDEEDWEYGTNRGDETEDFNEDEEEEAEESNKGKSSKEKQPRRGTVSILTSDWRDLEGEIMKKAEEADSRAASIPSRPPRAHERKQGAKSRASMYLDPSQLSLELRMEAEQETRKHTLHDLLEQHRMSVHFARRKTGGEGQWQKAIPPQSPAIAVPIPAKPLPKKEPGSSSTTLSPTGSASGAPTVPVNSSTLISQAQVLGEMKRKFSQTPAKLQHPGSIEKKEVSIAGAAAPIPTVPSDETESSSAKMKVEITDKETWAKIMGSDEDRKRDKGIKSFFGKSKEKKKGKEAVLAVKEGEEETGRNSQGLSSPLGIAVNVKAVVEALSALRRNRFQSSDELLSHLRESSPLRDHAEAHQLKRNCTDLFDALETKDNVSFSSVISENETEVPLVGADRFKLIQQFVLANRSPDPVFVSTILLTFRVFYTPLELLDMMIFRFYCLPPLDTSAENKSEWQRSVQEPIRRRVVKLVAKWIERYYARDFRDNGDMVDRLLNWLQLAGHISNLYPKLIYYALAGHVLRDIDKQKKKKPPKPHDPGKGRDLTLMEMHPTEVARQMTLIEFEIFSKITASECITQNWTKKDKREKAANIMNMIDRFNFVSAWVATEIVTEEDVKRRAIKLNRFIVIAEECRALHNYNAVMEILAGLQSAPIYRLKKTWELLPSKTWEIWDNLNSIMSNDDNYLRYRSLLKQSPPPFIPYLGINLTDLTFVEEGNKDYLPNSDDKLINITKLRYTASIIYDLEGAQQGEYNLKPLPQVQAYLLAASPLDEAEIKKLSLLREPRKS